MQEGRVRTYGDLVRAGGAVEWRTHQPHYAGCQPRRQVRGHLATPNWPSVQPPRPRSAPSSACIHSRLGLQAKKSAHAFEARFGGLDEK
eukprot:444344-Pyramimonas_sp.AAC.1